MTDTTKIEVNEAAGATTDSAASLASAAAFAGAESREILNLLGEQESAGACCGGSCCG